MMRHIALAAALTGALLLGWLGARTPAPAALDAPAETFSAGRALVDIETIAQRPHPVGTADNARVRDYVKARMTSLGLAPRLQAATSLAREVYGEDAWIVGGAVENLVGVLPGKDPGAPALLLMAHYDSVPGSPGAADDTTGVAAVLETVRALKTRGTPQRDVIVLITDGEEAGLLGARAFFAEDPLRKRAGLVINAEARGNGGRANMFQTGPDNGAIVAAFARTASRPVSNSLAVFLYENMPNDTDFSVSKDAGLSGLNFAFIGRQFDYHSATSTVANLDKGSVQHMGDQMLAAAAEFAFAPGLPGKAPDAVYSQTFGDNVLHYPAWAGWLLLVAIMAACAFALRRGLGEEKIPWKGLARGAGAAVLVLTGSALALHTARRVTGIDFGYLGQRPLLAQWALWETTLAVIAIGMMLLIPAMLGRGERRWPPVVSALIGGALCQIFGGWDLVGGGLAVASVGLSAAVFGKPVKIEQAWPGALAVGVLLALVLQVLAPTVALIVAWPLAMAALAALATDFGGRSDLKRLAAVTLLAALTGGWLAVYFHGVAQGLDLPAVLGLMPFLAALPFWPLAARDGRGALIPALTILAVGAVLVGVVRFGEPWSARHPLATSVLHVTDTSTGKSWRVSNTRALDDWSRQAITAEGGKAEQAEMRPLARTPIWRAAAAAAPATASAPLSVVRAADGAVVIEGVASGRVMMIDIESGPVTAASLNGQPVSFASAPPGNLYATPSGRASTRLRWQSDPGPVRLVMTVADGPVTVRYAVVAEGWPASARPLPPRPKDVMAWDVSDSTATIGAAKLP